MSKTSEFGIYSGNELLNTPTEEERYLIQDILWEGDHVFLLGKEKSGKSILALQMMCALTSGSAFLGKFEVPAKYPILYVQAEGKLRDTIERLKCMTSELGVEFEPDNFHLLYYHSISLDTPQGYEEYIRLTEHIPVEKHPKVIFLDPLYMSMMGDLIDNQCARNMVRNIRKICDAFNCAIVILHHENKPTRNKDGNKIERGKNETIFGSFVWSAFVDHVLAIDLKDNGFRRLSCDTQRTSKVVRDVEINLVHPYPLYFEIVGDVQKPYVSEVYNAIRCIDIEEGTTRQALVSQLNLSVSAVEKSLKVLLNEQKIVRLNPGRRPVKYILNPYTQPIKILSHSKVESSVEN